MRHPHHRAYYFSPGKHRSGLFFILLLVFLSEVRGLPVDVDDRFEAAKKKYFSQHPDFRAGDGNERRVNELIQKNLEGLNSHELPCLAAEMIDEPLYQQVLAKLEELQGESSSEPTSSRRRANRSRSRSKAKAMPKAAKAKFTAMAAKAKSTPTAPKAQSEVPGARSARSSSSNPKAQSEVPGARSAASNSSSSDPKAAAPKAQSAASNASSSDMSDDVSEDTDVDEWVERDCWVCKACSSMNYRFTQWCDCGTQREWQEDWGWKPEEGDWICPVCGNHNFAWREWCFWSDCPTKDWTCVCVCGNFNFARRRWCNRNVCQKPRPW